MLLLALLQGCSCLSRVGSLASSSHSSLLRCLLHIRSALLQVRALKDDARYAKLHELLTVFATQGLPEYQAFHAANGPLVASLGVDHEASLRAMRLLTLTSLAAAAKGPLAYDAVAAAISVSHSQLLASLCHSF